MVNNSKQDLTELERGIAREIQQVISEEGRAVTANSVRYALGHDPVLVTIPQQPVAQKGVPDVGLLSAEAVAQEFEVVAQEVESLGKDLSDVAQHCVEM